MRKNNSLYGCSYYYYYHATDSSPEECGCTHPDTIGGICSEEECPLDYQAQWLTKEEWESIKGDREYHRLKDEGKLS